ncbi:MAG: hypothetical protein LC631_03155, partial [Desulfovibrionales bacterium]|nr:hypothetical protein [Desulfovibrionales bacterium]
MNSLRKGTLIFVFALMLGGCYACPGYYCSEPGIVGNRVIEPATSGTCPVYTENIRSLPYKARYYDVTPNYRTYCTGRGSFNPACRNYYSYPYR